MSQNRYGDEESDHIRPRDPFIPFTGREQFMREPAPCYGLGIILLRLLARPNIRTLDGEQNFPLIVNDTVHQSCGEELKVSLGQRRCTRGEWTH